MRSDALICLTTALRFIASALLDCQNLVLQVEAVSLSDLEESLRELLNLIDSIVESLHEELAGSTESPCRTVAVLPSELQEDLAV